VLRAVALLSVLAASATDDRDRDGILDEVDACPDDPEDFDQFQDDDGCPEQWRLYDLPEPRLETGAGVLGTRLVMAGGFSGSMFEGLPITSKVLTFDTLTGAWGELPELPVAWTHANIAAVGGVVFALGGLDGRSFVADGRMFALEANATAWTELGSMSPEDARGGSAVVVSPGHVFLIGGASTAGVLASILDFDLETRTVSRFGVDLPIGRSHAAAMRRFDGMFVVAGGIGGLTGPQALSDVWVLPQDASVWASRAAMPTARGGCAYGDLYGNLVCGGGETATEAVDAVEIYSVATDSWVSSTTEPELLEPLPAKRAGARGAVVANRLYVPGGSETLEFIPTTTLFEFSLTAR